MNFSLNETHEFGGTKVKFVINSDTFEKRYLMYRDALMASRRIRKDYDNIDLKDPIYLAAFEALSSVDDVDRIQSAMYQAKEYYKSLLMQVNADAIMLAMIKENTFANTPEPYVYDEDNSDEEEFSELGLAKLPEIRYNLQYPVEKKLKQFLDIIAKDILYWNNVFETNLTAAVSKAFNASLETDPITGNTF